MHSILIFGIAGAAAASLIYGIIFWRQLDSVLASRVAMVLSLTVPVSVAAFLIARSIAAGFPLLSGTDSVFCLLAATATIGTWRIGRQLSGGAAAASHGPLPALRFWSSAAAAALLAAAMFPGVATAAQAPLPALRSLWLLIHVSTTIAGEGFFLLGFGMAIASLWSRHPENEMFHRLSAAAISIGYPLFTAGALLFGSLWAHQAWGRYWGWDPKEVWALVTWISYTVYLFLQISGYKRKTLMDIIAITGFVLALFTFLGVNLLFSSLHSYL